MKRCKKCDKERLLSEFAKDSRNKDGLMGSCKYCNHRVYKKKLIENIDRTCKKCGVFKKISEYWINFTRCKECMNSYKPNMTIAEKNRIKRHKRKTKVMNYYGNKCVCCGENHIDFLTIDHINNDGYILRKEAGLERTSGNRFYKWVIDNKYPDNLQILCWNCNCAKGFYGRCPHNLVATV